MPKRRTKRIYDLGKRCRCRDHNICTHAWWVRVFAHGKRQRINLTERYGLALPMVRADVEVHAAKGKDEARKGLIASAAHRETRLTLGDVADHYVEAYPSRSHHYVRGLRGIMVAVAKGALVKLETKPIDEITTADIKHAVKVWR